MMSISSGNGRLQYLQFLKELKQKMKEENDNYVLSVTVPAAGISQWEDGFDLREIVRHVDFFNVFTMDYYGPWPNQWGTAVGPTSPLYGGINEKKNFNVNYTMQYYKKETGEPSKLNIVIPFY
ncbi:hypothetical protein B9Z55_006066 [Caenorhabditis nigoni]|uniref:GH18 domain-containing protein n=1 Tax=Caenorhabditis nigoni TaxID=1611254 RepID=A0A2G5V3H0_9PELO|nr:hypothetical protein B9Z55_006066 [Caenorhabditis nigoni]